MYIIICENAEIGKSLDSSAVSSYNAFETL